MGRSSKFSPEVRERAVRLVLQQQDKHESHWAAIESIAGKMGCTAETLRKWVRQAERGYVASAAVNLVASPESEARSAFQCAVNVA